MHVCILQNEKRKEWTFSSIHPLLDPFPRLFLSHISSIYGLVCGQPPPEASAVVIIFRCLSSLKSYGNYYSYQCYAYKKGEGTKG